MAVYKRDMVDINLETGNIHRSFLKHSIGKADSAADHFGVRVFRNGEAVSLTGVSVQGYFRDPQGNNIAITSGNIVSENEAEVVLPQACYNYEGQFCLAIKLIGGGVTGTVRIVDGMVDNTNTGSAVAPTETVPTYQEVLAVYDQMQEKIEDYDEVVAEQNAHIAEAIESIAPEFSTSASYTPGQYVTYNGGLYICKTAHTGSWNAGHFSATNAGGELTRVNGTVESLNNFCRNGISYSKSQNTSVSAGTLNTTIVSDILIPSGTSYTIKVTDSGSVLPSSLLTLYYKDSSNTNHSIQNITAGTEYILTAPEDIYGFVGYRKNIESTGTITTAVSWRVENPNDNLEKRIEDLDDEVDEINNSGIIQNYSAIKELAASDLEVGGIQDGTGKLVDVDTRHRTKNYIPAYTGMVIKSVRYFNVFEYDLLTGQYLYSTSGWKTSYTVTQDCKIKMVFNSTSTSDIISGFSTETPFLTIRKSITPVDFARQIIGDMQYMPSKTVRTIAHRGRYGFNIGMECGLSGVVAAKRYGITIVENDVAFTADGKMVMWHDSTLSKIGDSTHSVSDYTLAQLKAMNFGIHFGTAFDGETILTFEEWIIACKKIGVECYIDFKVTGTDFTTSMAEDLVEIVKKYGMMDHVSYLNNQAKIRQYHNNARLVMLVPPTAERIESFRQYLANGPVTFDPNGENVTSEMAELALLNGYEMECYYVEYDITDKTTIFNEVDRLVGCGVQGITMDYYKIEDVFNQKYGLLN